MNQHEIQMCVSDCLRDDQLESFELIMKALNDQNSDSWCMVLGSKFSIDEVRTALKKLIANGLVTAYAEKQPCYKLQIVSINEIGKTTSWDNLWFHLEPAGHKIVAQWRESLEKRSTKKRCRVKNKKDQVLF